MNALLQDFQRRLDLALEKANVAYAGVATLPPSDEEFDPVSYTLWGMYERAYLEYESLYVQWLQVEQLFHLTDILP